MERKRPVAVVLAIASTLTPLAGLHKFYLGQPRWGLVYVLLSWTPLPHVASALEGLWYGLQSNEAFKLRFAPDSGDSKAQEPQNQGLGSIAAAIGLKSPPTSSPVALNLDVNRATAAEWQQLPGIDRLEAEMLGQLVRSGVQFHCLEDLAAALDRDPSQLQAWEPHLCFAYYEPEHLESLPQLNPNRATLQQLLQIPQMSPALAQNIIHHRIMQGAYTNLATFQQRLHLSPEQVQHLMHYLSFRDF